MAVNTTRFPLRSMQPRSVSTRRATHPPRPSDDEILGLVTAVSRPSTNPTQHAGNIAANKLVPSSARENERAVAGSEAAPARAATPRNSQPSLSDTASRVAAENAAQQGAQDSASSLVLTPEIAQILDAHPQLRAAWDTAQQFEAIFSSPAAAQDAKSQLDELDKMFFSADPAAQAALAGRIHELSPEAFHSLAQAMQNHARQVAGQDPNGNEQQSPHDGASQGGAVTRTAAPDAQHSASGSAQSQIANTAAPGTMQATASGDHSRTNSHLRSDAPPAGLSPVSNVPLQTSQMAFFHSTNAAAVHQVLAAIESQVTRLLPASVSTATKTRIVGEIYRDLGSALSSNRQLGHQLRQAFRSGGGDAAHQRAIVALVAGRARQAIPSIARRVINEWTHGVVAANQEKLSRQSASAKRVDISGAASSDGVNRRPVSPRDVDYKRLSDADILNL